MTARVLLLDAMDTLVVDPFFTVFPKFFGATLSEIFRDKDPEVWPRFERGEIDEVTWAALTFSDQRRFDLQALKMELFASYRFIDGIEALLGDLHAAGTEMHILSNYPIWYQALEERLHLTRWLPWTFVSWNVGLRKPGREIFDLAAQTLKRPASECVFVDDRESNCAGARAAGMEAIRFESALQLRQALQESEFLPKAREMADG